MTVTTITPLQFLQSLYGEDAPGYLILFTTNPDKPYPFSVDELESAVDLATSLSGHHNVYCGVGLQGQAPKPPKRGTADMVVTLPGLWIDLDIKGPAHKETALPRSQDEAKLILDAVPVPPTALLDSGHGLYAWWMFKEPWVLETVDERNHARSLAKRFQHKIRSRAKEHGWEIESTADLARVLRIPGTVNWKCPDDPRTVRVLKFNDHCRYEPGEIEEFLPDEESLEWNDTRADDSEFDPAPLEPIMAGCSWMRHCRDDAVDLPEPEWYAMLGIVGRTENGRQTAHELSAPYPGYTQSGTDEKLTHAMDAAGPRTCKYIREELGAEAHCQACPHWGEIKSPITLARRAQNSGPLERKLYKHTDLGNAERMVARHGDKMLYSFDLASWLLWNGKQWKPDNAGRIEQLAKDTVRNIYKEASDTTSDEIRDKLGKHAHESEKRPRLRAMIDGARSEVPILADDLDADPWLLNCLNGVIDLRTGELRPHDPSDRITKLAPVEYHPDADCPRFLAFLERITGDNAELTGYLQRLLGYALTGDTREQVFPIAWGTGANGKSTLFSTVLHILGDYATQTPTTTLVQRKGDAIPNDLAALRGKRLVLASEVDDGHRLSESLVKQITGGDRVSARFMRGEWFEFHPQFKTVLATNHKPIIKGTDHAIWRRIHLVPFTVTIPPEEQDATLAEKLRSEAPGILAWLVDGCRFWQSDGLMPPEIVQNATRAYRDDQDALEHWIRAECVIGGESRARVKHLYESYKRWAEQTGEEPMTQRRFSERLTERGFELKRTGQAWYRRGIGLLGHDAEV